jgi:hypothetical protein
MGFDPHLACTACRNTPEAALYPEFQGIGSKGLSPLSWYPVVVIVPQLPKESPAAFETRRRKESVDSAAAAAIENPVFPAFHAADCLNASSG